MSKAIKPRTRLVWDREEVQGTIIACLGVVGVLAMFGWAIGAFS